MTTPSEPMPARFVGSADRRLMPAAAVLLIALATILGAWGFQLIGQYEPCRLCLEQRIPYYVGVPVALAALAAAAMGAERATRVLLLITAGVFLWSLYLGVRHAGVEWAWWEGPGDCGVTTAPAVRDAGTLLGQLETIRVASCSEATWRLPNAPWGLSFAGWNAVISAVLVALALTGAFRRRKGG